VLRVEPIEAAAWWRLILAASLTLVVIEIDKAVRRRLARRRDRQLPAVRRHGEQS
jgi:Ca2+-transporting ATPase